MILIKHDGGVIYTPGLKYETNRNGDSVTVSIFDKTGKQIKSLELKTESMEIEVL